MTDSEQAETAMRAWAQRYPDAACELQNIVAFANISTETPFHNADERDISNYARLRASEQGGRLFRNNNGGGRLENGLFMRWGLNNDSPKHNAYMKSADLIGIKPILITAEMTGTYIGQFWSFEAKSEGWRYSGTAHEQAQQRWQQLIISLGGCAKMGTSL